MPSLGLAMIVKDGANTLRNCIASVAGVTDRIVIADTGSSDGTSQLARELGAEVFDFPWQDDFAQARNAAARALSTDWVLVMDDDEELDSEARARIPSLLENVTVGGYLVTHRNYVPVKFGSGGHAPSIRPTDSTNPRAERARGYADFAICRLFRHHPGIYYVGRVHEHVEPRIHALGLTLSVANIVIHHFGHLCSPAELHAKNEFYRRLGRLKVKDTPNDPEAWVELGLQEYEQFKNYSAGIECFKKALDLNPRFASVPCLSLANLYVEIQSEERALELLSRTAMSGRAAGEKERICGDAFYNLGRFKDARSAYLRASQILSEDARVASKLGLTEVPLGLKKNGLARLTKALRANPDEFEMHDRLIKAYILADMMPQAAEAAERAALEMPSSAIILRAASIRAQMQNWNAAEETIVRGLQLFPQNQALLNAKAELERQVTPVCATMQPSGNVRGSSLL
ncbi:MAG: glycosyltransferase [Candidatus Sulfotelmatobacter sp.]